MTEYAAETTYKKRGDCDECGTKGTTCVVFVAEHNAGELYDVKVCRECLLRHAEHIQGEDDGRDVEKVG